MNRRSFSTLVLFLLTLLTVANCAPVTPAPVSTPTLAALFSEKVDVGGYGLQILCSGVGTPTVIVDDSYSGSVLEDGNWLNVRYGIEKTNRICIYDPAGAGVSDLPPARLRTSQDLVKDLHTLLVNAHVPGPYILVGHNLGGFNARLYASQYPDEVAGMVLVDSFHPDYPSQALAALPAESPDEPESLRLLRSLLTKSELGNSEGSNSAAIDFNPSAEQVRATAPRGDLPLVVVTRSPAWRIPDLSPDIMETLDQVWQELQVDLTTLSSNSTHVIAPEPGYNTPFEEPQLVIDAIRKVIAETKK
jgi:pimeloyl-ACP methyl ester carboxylesterase